MRRDKGTEQAVRRTRYAGLSLPSARSSTDRASDYGSEGWGFESLRARPRSILPLTCTNVPRQSPSASRRRPACHTSRRCGTQGHCPSAGWPCQDPRRLGPLARAPGPRTVPGHARSTPPGFLVSARRRAHGKRWSAASSVQWLGAAGATLARTADADGMPPCAVNARVHYPLDGASTTLAHPSAVEEIARAPSLRLTKRQRASSRSLACHERRWADRSPRDLTNTSAASRL